MHRRIHCTYCVSVRMLERYERIHSVTQLIEQARGTARYPRVPGPEIHLLRSIFHPTSCFNRQWTESEYM